MPRQYEIRRFISFTPLTGVFGIRLVSEPRAVATGSAAQLPMQGDYIDFQDRSSPIGYLITFRCYGKWLHGDERGAGATMKAITAAVLKVDLRMQINLFSFSYLRFEKPGTAA